MHKAPGDSAPVYRSDEILHKHIKKCVTMKNVFHCKQSCPLEVAIKAVLQHSGNVVNTTCHIQHAYNVTPQHCEHIAAQHCTLGSSNIAATSYS